MLVIPAPGWRQEVPQSLRRERGPAHTWIVTSGLWAALVPIVWSSVAAALELNAGDCGQVLCPQGLSFPIWPFLTVVTEVRE